jgi:predicted phosphoadenosine phosphosulfate sulfurtransferase
MPKIGLGINVVDAAEQRIRYTFDNFERVYLSFSAGKDSTIMLHLAARIAREIGRKFAVLIVDLEGQYKLTIKHAQAMLEEYCDVIEPYWVCLPIHLRNAVSVYDPFWLCWDPNKEASWVREMPNDCISDENYFPFFQRGMEFEEFVPEFGEWYSQGKTTACMVGIRADESLNRYRTIATDRKVRFDDKQWSTKVTESVYNIYPIYDWSGSDIWAWHGKNPDARYNQLYDLMHKAGVPLGHMRICQPYGDDQRRGLWLFHLIEPETWARVVARVNGANGGALYMQDNGNISGYRRVSKPEGHTWKSFCELLVKSMPPTMGEHYKNKILLFEKWWTEKGYPEGIPDEADYNLEQARRAPSWRRVAKSLLRNDYWCKGLGFSQHKSAAYKKYLDLMKRRKEKWNIEERAIGFKTE